MRRGHNLLLAGMAVLGLSACTGYHDGYGPGYYSGGGYDGYRYDGTDYGAMSGGALLDPWLGETEEGREIVALGFAGPLDADTARRANVWFRRYADSDGDMRLTDPEIRLALVQASREHGGGR